ncbi:MAG: TIGR00730 family Rossman fold protein [Stellaceae bacterium]
MAARRTLCVYCGSSGAVAPAYREAASALGAGLAAAGIEIVFGGGRVGLMGLLADAALAAGGRVTGIIPARLRDAELAHPGLSELVVVAGMQERKALMAERADAFAVLPGGIGTLDEMFEMLSWRQLGLHDKPIFLVDIDGYWATLVLLLDEIVARGFARPQIRLLFRVVPSIADLLEAVAETPGGVGGVRDASGGA